MGTIRYIFPVIFVFIFIGCGGGGGSSSGGTGTLSLSMTDAASDFAAVYVTIDEVQIHLGGNDSSPNNWRPINMQRRPITVNLLTLTNEVREQLGLVDLPTGDYTQVRLIIGNTPENSGYPYANYVVDKNIPPNIYELKVPSGNNTGFKIVENFTIEKDQILELVLDFDASRSIIQAGASGQWLLKPTVKIDYLREASIVKGRVTTDGTTGIVGAMVSAQQYLPSATDNKDKVSVVTSTITDANGNYALFLSADTYNIVATMDGKETDFFKVSTLAGKKLFNQNFQLGVSQTSAVGGTVTITGGGLENYATLSFRQEAAFPPQETIEVKSINVLNGSSYSVSLPVGSYTLVASSLGYTTQTQTSVTVAIENPDVPTTENVTF